MSAHADLAFPDSTAGLRANAVLNNGYVLPWVGLGVFQIKSDAQTAAVVRTAIEQGYRGIDTASLYGNERGVGEAVRSCGVPREELFVTTKVWNDAMRADKVAEAFEESMRRLGLEYLDLYLLHWPIKGHMVSSWRALETLHRTGRVKAIGVSNYMIAHFEELLPHVEIKPMVNQIEYHPYLQSPALIDYCQTRGIQVQAWSPLMQAGALLRDRTLVEIGARHGKSAAQVVLRWDLQTRVATIPKSADPKRIAENADLFDFALDADEMAAIARLDRGQRCGADPLNFRF
ncbi:aldo/keto reductase [Horticoccus luteus]|uniref:Aldo/keto reductase n=1 Tax=Horticoccus luteus TaxID=2862869 RepID=A0A8F9TXG6_9BACT|nr:aldo/keto reductase [Horticoccus luteus]QYM79925.1 aldo/keto reductase [Horticoccus luteus]